MDAPGIAVPGVEPRDPSTVSEEQITRDTYFDPKLAADARARAAAGNAAVTQANRQLVKKLAWQRRNHDPQLQRWLSRIRIPTHIVWGADDRLFPPVYGETWAKAIAGAKLTVIPRCGHLPIQEQPDIFAASVAEFCARA
jgi:pimeloyl-ACP methyl ester carboxylesterase